MTFVGPFDIAGVIEHVKAGALGFNEVAGAAELDAAAKATSAPTPCAYVLLAKESGHPKVGGSALHIQAVDVTFSIVLAIRNYRHDQRGTAQLPELTALTTALRNRLVGWIPPGSYPQITAVDFTGGALVSYDAAVIWWMETYTVRYWIR